MTVYFILKYLHVVGAYCHSGNRNAPVLMAVGLLTWITDMTAMRRWPDDDVILYDGVCIFCSRWIRFVIARDVARRFRVTPIQSPYGTRLAQAFGINPDDPDTNAVVHGGQVFVKSDAALTVLSLLPRWSWTGILLRVPKFIRDPIYNLLARNRYRIFGKYEQCFVPDGTMRARLME